jgi:hypothetical protein
MTSKNQATGAQLRARAAEGDQKERLQVTVELRTVLSATSGWDAQTPMGPAALQQRRAGQYACRQQLAADAVERGVQDVAPQARRLTTLSKYSESFLHLQAGFVEAV